MIGLAAPMDLTENNAYFLQPGYIYFSKGEGCVRTVVGSCVSVCLWDKTLRFGGMNHFLHPRTREPGEATPRFGNVATAALIRMMEEAGCQRRDIVAQILGGAFPEWAKGKNIGAENVRAARDTLGKKGILVASEDVGGCLGRKIVFDTRTGQLVVLKVQDLRSDDWIIE